MSDDVLTFEQLREIQRAEKDKDTLHELGDRFFERANDYLEMKERMDTFESDREHRNAKHIIEDIMDRRQKKILRLAFLSTKSNLSIDNLHPTEEEFFDRVKEKIKMHQERLEDRINGEEKKEDEEQDKTSGGRQGKEEEAEVVDEEAPGGPIKKEEDERNEEKEENVEEKEEKVGRGHAAEEESKSVSGGVGGGEESVPDGYKKVRITEAVSEFMGPDMEAYGPFEPGATEVLPESVVGVLEEQDKIVVKE